MWVKHGWGAYNGVAAKACLFRAGAKSWGGGEIHPSISLTGIGGRLTGHIDHFVESLNEFCKAWVELLH